MTSLQWHWESRNGSVSALHARPLQSSRWVEDLSPAGESVVLGSAQQPRLVDSDLADSLGIEVAQRRGGGGAVWLAPGAQLWLEFTIPPTDPLWLQDVGEAFMWLGELFRETLAGLGVAAQVHRSATVASAASGLVCFGGLGPGEIVVGGQKLVGISQRRTRAGARFQLVMYERLDHRPLVSLFGLGGSLADELLGLLASSTTDAQRLGISIVDVREKIRDRIEAEFGT
ncbi:MAG: hypothetical protein ACC652_04130 [Acidimicrobiales bacterium]